MGPFLSPIPIGNILSPKEIPSTREISDVAAPVGTRKHRTGLTKGKKLSKMVGPILNYRSVCKEEL